MNRIVSGLLSGEISPVQSGVVDCQKDEISMLEHAIATDEQWRMFLGRNAWIQTLGGYQFFPCRPDQFRIELDTIALVLARTPRFAGHFKSSWYSVAQHSVLVSQIVQPDLQLAALFHDAHEAYSGFGDVCRPVKQLCPIIRRIELAIDEAIAAAFFLDVNDFEANEIKQADTRMLVTERRDLMGDCEAQWEGEWPDPLPEKIDPWPLEKARAMFVRRYYALIDERNERRRTMRNGSLQGA